MSSYDPFSLGILLVILALFFLGGAWLLLRTAPRLRSSHRISLPDEPVEGIENHSHAVLIVESGGRLTGMNEKARLLFQVQENEISSLELLLKRLRPGELFLKLCAAEGQARFFLDGKPFEANSYRVKGEKGDAILVAMQPLEQTEGSSQAGMSLAGATLQKYNQMAQQIAASLDLESTLKAIFENVEKFIPAEFIEITLWDKSKEKLIPYRFLRDLGEEKQLEPAGTGYSLDEGYSGYLARERSPLLIPNLRERTDLLPSLDLDAIPLRSFIGVPLMFGQELIGTLEIGALTAGTYQQNDLDLLRLISGQAAVALHNAWMYRDEQHRSAELTGLAQLAQAVGAAKDPQALYTRLVESIVPLVSSEVVGFLLYQESQRALIGQVPFYGVPPQFIEIYRTNIVPGSLSEGLVTSQQMIVSPNAAEDPQWVRLGLDHLAQAASLSETVLAPLVAGGRMLGYLQVSNHVGGSVPYTDDELRLITIIANQAAPVIENFTLVQQTRLRAQRAEALRRIASLASSAATLDEILQFSLQELAHLLKAEVAAVFLIDRSGIALQLHSSSLFGIDEPPPERITTLLVDDAQYPFTMAGGLHTLTLKNKQHDKPVIPYYQQIIAEWGLESLLITPFIVRDEGIGEIWVGSRSPDYFEAGDVQVLSTAAGQLAGVVERSFLINQTDESLRRRVDQLTALTRISRELSTSLDLGSLLQLVYDEAVRTTRADCGSLALFDVNRLQGQEPRIRFLVGEPSAIELSPLELSVLEKGEPLLVADIAETDFPPPHEGVAALMIIPIYHQGERGGLILLHAKSTGRFDNASLEIAQSLAAQAAVALGNALQYEQQAQRTELLRREIETLSGLFKVFHELREDRSLEESLQIIAGAIQQATLFRMVVISIFDEDTGYLRRVAGIGLTEDLWADMCANPPQWASIAQVFEPKFRVGSAYFIPADHVSIIPDDIKTFVVLDAVDTGQPEIWNPEDMLLAPLFDADQKPLGLISVDAPVSGRRPDQPVFEALDLFTMQTCLTIDTHRQIQSLQSRLRTAESGTGQLQQSIADVQQSLPMLLRRDLEHTVTSLNLQRQLEQVRASLDITAQAVRQATGWDILRTVAVEILNRFNYQTALIAETSPEGPQLIEVVGSVPAGANLEALFGQRNPLRQILQDGKMLLAATLESLPEWQNNALLNALEARCYIGLPLEQNNGRMRGILAVSARPQPAFTETDYEILSNLGVLVSAALQNLDQLDEFRQRLQELDLLLLFSRRLGSLDPAGILNTLLETIHQALPQAGAAWVGIWSEKTCELKIQAALGYNDGSSLLKIQLTEGDDPAAWPIPLKAFHAAEPLRVDEVAFARDYILTPDDLLLYRQAAGGKLPVSSLLIPMRLGNKNLGVLVLENFIQTAAFNEEDELLAQSLAQQAALAMENANLYFSAQQRAAQLQALTRVSGAITSNLQSDVLVDLLLDQLKSVLPYETATLWLRSEGHLTVAAANGFEDDESRVGISVNLEDSLLFQEMIKTGQPLSIADIRHDSRFPAIVEVENLSWLATPLITKSEVMGVLALEKLEAGFYTPEHIQLVTMFAGQAAISLENARLFEESFRRAGELDQRSQRLALLNRFSSEVGVTLDADTVLNLTAQQLLEALNGSRVDVILVGEKGRGVLHIEKPSTSRELPQPLPYFPLLERLHESQGIFSTPDVADEPELSALLETYFIPRQTRALLMVPLVAGADLIGWVWLQTGETYRFTLPEIELARTISNQAAIAVQNARLYNETLQLTEDLERRVAERTIELRREHQNTDTLLRIITELSASLDMDQVLSRTLAVLNESLSAEQSLILLKGSSRIYRYGLPLFEIVDNQPGESERQISDWIIRHKATTLVDDITADARWDWPQSRPPAYKSVIAAPLIMGEETLGSVMLFHHSPAAFVLEQVGVMEATARQISVAISNAELFNLIRDQAENLGELFREQELEANRSRAILEAVADGVLVTDSDIQIMLFNASAERILGVAAENVINQSLDRLSSLFERSTSAWLETIRRWSEDPQSCEPGIMYAEEVDLENGAIIAIHLAPVILRSIFMGTVSIFRDITQEVQVDRMKAEFIANVSHELRTPMTSIKGYVDVMLMGASGELNDQQKRFLTIVKGNTERLSVLVNDLLDVSRIDSGRVSLSIENVKLLEITTDVVADIVRRSREENKEINIMLDAPDDLPAMDGDPERIRQIMENLVRNAYYYTPKGGQVTVRIRPVNGNIQVDVHDSGIGIPQKDQRRIFERFFRGSDPLVLATAGNGLGLALSKTLIEMHHGKIWFESSGVPGEGSVFSFTLPQHMVEE